MKKPTLQDKVRIVLAALFSGKTIVVENEKFCFDQDYCLCVERLNVSSNTPTLVKVSFGYISLRDFIGWVGNISDEQIFFIIANNVLTNLRKNNE